VSAAGWNEQTYAQAIAGGLGPEEIARIEHGVMERRRSEDIRNAFELYYNDGVDPQQIAESLAGDREVQDVFLRQWAMDEGEYDVEPLSPSEFVAARYEQDVALERAAEAVRAGQADAEQRRAVAEHQRIAQEFAANHPDHAQLDALIPHTKAATEAVARRLAGEEIADPAAVLESAYQQARTEYAVGERVELETGKPFAKVSVTQEMKRTSEVGPQFLGEAPQVKANRAYEERLASLPAQMTEAEESALYAERWAAKSAPNFNGALVTPKGAPATNAERDAQHVLSRRGDRAAAMAEFQDGRRNRSAAFAEAGHAASIPDAEATGGIPEAAAPESPWSGKSPKTWW
jgi:hypothetical protein